MSTIRSDVADTETTTASDEFDATSAFLSSFGDDDEGDEDAEKQPSKPGAEEEDDSEPTGDDEDAEGSDESPETEGDDGEASDDAEGSDKKYAESDDIFVKVKVGDEEHEVPVKDLKRLYGQESALTKKSQEVSALRQQAESRAKEHVTALQVLLNRAQEKSNPYRQIDWMAVSKDPNISAEEASLLRSEAQKAFEEESFLGENLQGFMTAVQKQEQDTRIESAKTCVKALTTPGTDDKPNPVFIEGWNPKLYDEVREFGVKMGLPAETVNTLTDAAAIKMMHMAMQFAKGTSKVQTIKTNKVNKTPKKIVKATNAPVAREQVPVANRKAAIKALRANPNREGAAANAFYASFGGDDE